MEKIHKTAVVLSPPQSDWETIQAIREKYDRNFRRWMPHVTLFYPFYPTTHFDTVVEPLAEVCKRFESFKLSFNSFRFFQHGRRGFTLWLDPDPQDAVCSLQEALWQVVPDCDDTRKHSSGFTPHLSVGQVRSRAEVDEVLAVLQANWQPLIVRATRVDLIWRNDSPDDVFRVSHSIALGTGQIQRMMTK